MDSHFQSLLSSLAEDFPLILSLSAASFSNCDPSDITTALSLAYTVLPNAPSPTTVEFALDQIKVGFYQFVGWVKSTMDSDLAIEVSYRGLVCLSEAILAFLHSALQPSSNSALSDHLNSVLQAIERVRNPTDAIIVIPIQSLAISKLLFDISRMKASLKAVARAEVKQLEEQAKAVIQQQITHWEEVVMEWMKPETLPGECEGMVERCRKVADEVDYLEASVFSI